MEIYVWLKNFFFHYQTLIAGIFALSAAIAAWWNMKTRLEKEDRDETEYQKGLARLLLLDILNAKHVVETNLEQLQKVPNCRINLTRRPLIYPTYLGELPRLPGHAAAAFLTAIHSFEFFAQMCDDREHSAKETFQLYRENWGKCLTFELEVSRLWFQEISNTPIDLNIDKAKARYLSASQIAEFKDLISKRTAFVSEAPA